MTKGYGVLYCIWDNEDVVKFSEVIRAKSLEDAIKRTDRNLELNVVIPLNSCNKEHIKKLLGWKSTKKLEHLSTFI